jgi:hypothetical protein
MSPRFTEDVAESFVDVPAPRTPGRQHAARNLLVQDTVPMTVLAQDPTVVGPKGPVRARIPVPAERLQRGPRGHRFAVVDEEAGAGQAAEPVVLTDGDPWTYVDRWRRASQGRLAQDPGFRAQNVYAVAAHTLALVEQNLGRPVPWFSGTPELRLIPQAEVKAAAFYSREQGAVLFGWLPPFGDRPALHTALSYDVIAHEVTHAILDGLRPRFADPGLPDQLAFHEALADLVALLSVFTLDGVAEALLGSVDGRVRLDDGGSRAQTLLDSPLARLAEQLGSHRRDGGGDADHPALRWSALLAAGTDWKKDPRFAEPHRRSEVLVAAFMQTLIAMWVGRLAPLSVAADGTLDAARVAEEGVKSAQHLLGMLLRALDYLPPVDLEFADVLDAVLTADRRLAPDDDHGYRTALRRTFERFGIRPPRHHIVDEDGVAAPHRGADADERLLGAAPDPDAGDLGLRYEHLNLAALRTSPEEIYQFLWNNAGVLQVDVRFPTRIERVLSSTRVGPDGLVVTEILADYTQTRTVTAGALPSGLTAPPGMAAGDVVELRGGGVLVFDQFGRFRLHQRQPLLDAARQQRRLRHLVGQGTQPFALLHEQA